MSILSIHSAHRLSTGASNRTVVPAAGVDIGAVSARHFLREGDAHVCDSDQCVVKDAWRKVGELDLRAWRTVRAMTTRPGWTIDYRMLAA